MKSRTKSEWLDWYKGRVEDYAIEADEKILYHPEHGFVTFSTNEDVLEVGNMCGDGKYWFGVLKEIMKMERLSKLTGFTRRNPAAWERKYGVKVKGYYVEVGIDEIKV